MNLEASLTRPPRQPPGGEAEDWKLRTDDRAPRPAADPASGAGRAIRRHDEPRRAEAEPRQSVERGEFATLEEGDHRGEDASKLYYHVKELYRVGLVDLVETRVVGGVAEKYYKAVQAQIDDEARQAMSDLADKDPAETGRILGNVVNAVLASVLTEFSWVSANLEGLKDAPISVHGRYLELTREAADRLVAEVGRATEEAHARGAEGEDTRRYMQVDLLFPVRRVR